MSKNEATATPNKNLIDEELVKFWKSLERRPRVIAVDLDYTLWPYFVDCHVDPPLARRSLSKSLEIVVDSNGFDLSGFADVPRILHTLKHACLTQPNEHLAVASRSTTERLARKVIDELGWTAYFSSFQIYPTNKINHMKRIRDELNGSFDRYEDVLFFDDDFSNIKSTRTLGVCAVQVDESSGLSMKALRSGLQQYQAHSKSKKKN